MIEDDPPSRFAAPADKLGLCCEFEDVPHYAESVTPFQTKKTLEALSNSCHGLLRIGEDVLCADLFSRSIQDPVKKLSLDSPGCRTHQLSLATRHLPLENVLFCFYLSLSPMKAEQKGGS